VAAEHLEAIRLVKTYRGYRSGVVIRATAGLAERLVHDGLAVREPQRSLLDEARDGRVERAVATQAAAEVRGANYGR
jgi:hypothetical protein